MPAFLSRIAEHLKGLGSRLAGALRRDTKITRTAVLSCIGLLVCGAVFLVCFAIASPELPPGSLTSTINDVAENYNISDNYASSQVVLLPGEEQNWAALTAFDDGEEETGAGAPVVDRSTDLEYRIRPGETLSEIAYSYGISYDLLAYYNNISNANRIRVGTVIKIPSLDHERTAAQAMARQPRRNTAPARSTPRSVRIAFESRDNGEQGGAGLTVQFRIVDPPAENLQSFEWDFGDGKRGFRPNPSYEYTTPKTYVVRLTARDAAGAVYRSNPLYVDIPHPGSVREHNTTRFVTLSSPDEYFVAEGSIVKVARYQDLSQAPLDLSESDKYLTKVRFERPGYYGLTILQANNIEQYYSVFVSPIPTMHADSFEEDFNWYRTQFNTGTTSNCGPASASMAIGWALGRYFPVSSVRQTIGWQGDGGTSFEELLRVIKNQEIPAYISPIRSVQNIKDVIDSGNIAIILFHTDGVRTSRADPAADLFGKYYNDSVGHYIVIKGYSLNGEYLVTHDPIPSDWGVNSFRYGDELSMIGRNRYYASNELLRSLRRADMIVVPRINP
ncbi:MAG: LysM peptidoglycan-binding domain-containing protein [Spirochaetaceae bacterium]|nr:LysM peptidoglycan-binding domain-containing protein [Spirochaetaceae bacterium]